jgi:hypothetical protein
MREVIEFRMGENTASGILGEDVGVRIGPRGFVRKLELTLDDPLLQTLAAAEADARQRGQTIFTYWNINRKYTAKELAEAELVQLLPTAMFEPAGEECGTRYDYSSACPVCGAGRVHISDLILDTRRIPAKADLAFTIARDEFVVSGRLAKLIVSEGLSGARLRPVKSLVPPRAGNPEWFQPTVDSEPLVTTDATKYGNSLLVEPEKTTCPPGHVVGMRVFTELFVDCTSWKGADWVQTRDLIGTRRGLLAPYHLLVVSQRCWRLLRAGGFRGFAAEVVHVASDDSPSATR